jgi:hypothetical protein
MEVCSQNSSDPNTVLLKLNGNKCNMACEYCSELPKNFSADQCTFDIEKVKLIIEKLPRNTDIILHGGEPSLIGMENLYIIIKFINKLSFDITPSIQTNGYLDNRWVNFFSQNRDLIKLSVSIDGDYECNSFRRTAEKNSLKAFNKVDLFLRNIDREAISFRCIATINSNSWKYGTKIIDYFNKFNNLKFLRLNPCFDIDRYGLRKWAITPHQYLVCLKSSFKRMLDLKTYKKFKLDPISDIINGLDNDASVFEFKCNKFLSIFPNGLMTSCDAMREFEQKIDIEKVFQNTEHPDYVRSCIDICSKCKYLAVCKGGCPPLMYRYMLYAPNLLNEYCEYRVKIRQYVKEVVKT